MIFNAFSWGSTVLIPLLLFSILAVALILERLIFWYQIQSKQKQFIEQFFKHYPHDLESTIMLLNKYNELPIARVFLSAIELKNANSEEFRLALESSAQAELPLLKRFGTVLETVVGVAPLLGLLGTVIGLMETFSALKIGDIAGTKTASVTVGISDALLSTAVGLIVAIIVLLFANMFRGLTRRQMAFIQQYGGRLELLYRLSQKDPKSEQW